MVNSLYISAGANDIIDEAIYFFKANVFFKSYEIKVLLFNTATLCFKCLVLIMKDHVTELMYIFPTLAMHICLSVIQCKLGG